MITSILATFVAIFAIIFEGNLKEKKRGNSSNIRVLLKNTSKLGWLMIALIIILNVLNGIGNHNLKSQVEEINIKSDSIKLSIINTSIKALDEQRKLIEFERENIFANYQWEIQENMEKILMIFGREDILGFVNTDKFISTRLSSTYLNKYKAISTDKYVIGYLMQTEEIVNKVNEFCEHVLTTRANTEARKANIRSLLSNIEKAKDFLYPIYNRIYNLNSYKDYEQIDFSDSIPPIDRFYLNNTILQHTFQKPFFPDSIRLEVENKFIIYK